VRSKILISALVAILSATSIAFGAPPEARPVPKETDEFSSDGVWALTPDISMRAQDIPKEIKACVAKGKAAIEAITDHFAGPERKADCPPATLIACETARETVPLTTTLAGPWKIDGSPVIHETSRNDGGWFSPGGHTTRVLSSKTVEAFAECRGEGCGGGGTWAAGFIEGTKRREVTNQDMRHIVGQCVQQFGASVLAEKNKKATKQSISH